MTVITCKATGPTGENQCGACHGKGNIVREEQERKSHTITVGDFVLEVGLDEQRVLLDLTQLLSALHHDCGQAKAESNYAYKRAEELLAERDKFASIYPEYMRLKVERAEVIAINERLRKLCAKTYSTLILAGDRLNWPEFIGPTLDELRAFMNGELGV